MVFKFFHSFIKLSSCTAKNHDFREYENHQVFDTVKRFNYACFRCKIRGSDKD